MKHAESFSFAGFTWPRQVARMACGPAALRRKWAGRRHCGEYQHAPMPNANNGRGFYLNDAGQPFKRWTWADDVPGSGIKHNGWFADLEQNQTIRGIVARLPHGRFLAGYAMGEHMAAAIEPEIFTDESQAAAMADECARIAAENEIEYQEKQAERMALEDAQNDQD